nr:hypothetical protein [Nostoc sp. SerVER01]
MAKFPGAETPLSQQSTTKSMGKIKVRLDGDSKDIKAFSEYLHKMEESFTTVSMVAESPDYPNRGTTDVRRYLQFKFNLEVTENAEPQR